MVGERVTWSIPRWRDQKIFSDTTQNEFIPVLTDMVHVNKALLHDTAEVNGIYLISILQNAMCHPRATGHHWNRERHL